VVYLEKCAFIVTYKYNKEIRKWFLKMHEMSLALNIVEIITNKAREEEAEKITEIELEIGQLAGVEQHALEFCMEAACRDSLAEGARVTYYPVEALARCGECGHEFTPEFIYDRCPSCNGFRVDVVKGKEFKIRSINID
jgi:hydrogenase nickel incorporation protein HypA/HybF